ncbi:MAG: GspH/FimT family pseudopilin [Kangiellaceae bacterium]
MLKESNIINQFSNIKTNKGFTILELLITMVIAFILSTLAVPAFNNFLDNSRLTSNTNLVIGSLNLARSEAIRLGESVRAEGTANGFQLVIATGADAGDVIKQFSPSNKDITITADAAVNTVTYTSTGFRDFADNVAGDIHVCDDEGNGTDIHISSGGSITTEESTTC